MGAAKRVWWIKSGECEGCAERLVQPPVAAVGPLRAPPLNRRVRQTFVMAHRV